jgi:hypothetical protein
MAEVAERSSPFASRSRPPACESLTPDEKEAFKALQAELGSADLRYARHCQLRTFTHALARLFAFCHLTEANRSRRYRACGICELSRGVAVNTRELTGVLHRSKSLVNALFVRIGFVPMQPSDADIRELGTMIECLDPTVLRNWTVRRSTKKQRAIPEAEAEPAPEPEPEPESEEDNEWEMQHALDQFL